MSYEFRAYNTNFNMEGTIDDVDWKIRNCVVLTSGTIFYRGVEVLHSKPISQNA
jgi:hypothetical protein